MFGKNGFGNNRSQYSRSLLVNDMETSFVYLRGIVNVNKIHISSRIPANSQMIRLHLMTIHIDILLYFHCTFVRIEFPRQL